MSGPPDTPPGTNQPAGFNPDPSASAFDGVAGASAAPTNSDPAQQGAIATRIVDLDPEGGRQTRIVDVNVPAVVRRAARERAQENDRDESPASLIEESLTSLRHFYMRMHRFDRWTCWLLLAAFVSAFMPWQRLRGVGLVSGLEGLGWGSIVASLVAFGCLYWRMERRRLSGLLITLQMLFVAGVAGAPLLRLLYRTPGIGLVFGVYTTLGFAALALVFTFLRLTRINV